MHAVCLVWTYRNPARTAVCYYLSPHLWPTITMHVGSNNKSTVGSEFLILIPYRILQGDCKWMDPPIQKGQITILLCTEIINFCTWLMGMKKLIFHFTNFFCWGHFLIHHFWKKWAKNDPSKKNFASKKSVLSYHSATKEFLKSMFYFQTFLSEICCSCVLPFLRQNVLSRASINSE